MAGAGLRTGWALPPQPPEEWVDSRWRSPLLAVLGVSVALPAWTLLADRSGTGLALAALHAVAAVGAATTAYVLLVQAGVTGEGRLRWAAAGAAFAWPVVLLRAVLVDEAGAQDRAAALLLLGLLSLPVLVLLARPSQVGVGPLVGVDVLAAVLLALLVLPVPDLVDDDARLGALRAAALALAALALGAAARWALTTRRGTSRWVTVGLLLLAVCALLLAVAQERYGPAWWAGQVALATAFAVPAAGLALVDAAAHRRQVRGWHALVSVVARLRGASPLVPGLSVSPEDDEGLPDRRQVHGLIDAGHVDVALQPVVALDSGDVVGFEALSRFGGGMPTDRWFRGASRCGLGGELERLTLRVALELLPTLPQEAFLAVNVSPEALRDEAVLELLRGSDLQRLVVEVTEHEAVADYPHLRAVLDGLRAGGARSAVDDTGAGFASLRHVLMLQPDVVKLDSSLCRHVHRDERQRDVVRALVGFAAEVGAAVLAEGVETEEQLQALRELGVPLGQGWHLGVPVVVTERAV